VRRGAASAFGQAALQDGGRRGDEIREAHRVMEANEAGGKMVVFTIDLVATSLLDPDTSRVTRGAP
jgi:hypothetical protein